MSETTAANPLDDVGDLPWREKLLRMWMLTRLGHEGAMLDKMQQQNARVLAVADAARTGTMGTADAKLPEGEDMGVSIGNQIYNYHMSEQNKATATTGGTVAKTAGSLGKAALIAAALGGGPLTAVVMSYLNRPTTTIVEPPPIVQDVEYESGFVPLDK